MDRALIIDDPWISKIYAGIKPWEMRTRPTKIRGRIYLIKKGSGVISGEAFLYDSPPYSFNREGLIKNKDKHCIDYENNWNKYKKWRYPWVFKDIKEYDKPIPYDHPQGAVIWVKINLPVNRR
jgi:hypothetical protein